MPTSLLLFAWRAINRLAPLFYGEKSGASLIGYVQASALLLAGVDDSLAYAVLRHRACECLIGVVHDEADDARADFAIVLVGCGERDLLALVGVGTLLRSVCLGLEDGATLCGYRGGLRDELRAVNKAKDCRGGLCFAIILQLLLDVLPLRSS